MESIEIEVVAEVGNTSKAKLACCVAADGFYSDSRARMKICYRRVYFGDDGTEFMAPDYRGR